MCKLRLHPKKSGYHTRHSPDAARINAILNESEVAPDSDYICNACYKTQLAMLKPKDVTDVESELRSKIEDWKKIRDSEGTQDVDKAILHTTVYVAIEIMNQRALLLSQASNVFLWAYANDNCSDINNTRVLDVGDSSTNDRLLNNLILYLQPYNEYKCVHKRFGTILYWRDGDILTSLLWALERAHIKESNATTYDNSYKPRKYENVLIEAASMMNDKIHAEIAKYNTDSNAKPDDINIEPQTLRTLVKNQ